MQELPLIPALVSFLLGILFLQWPFWVLSILAGMFLFFRNGPARPKNVSNFFYGFCLGGHRGSPMNAPENTMPSFKQAENEGVDLIEFDIGLTKDKVPVLMHDDLLDRTTNMYGPLREHLWTELATCNCAAKFQWHKSKLPTNVGNGHENGTIAMNGEASGTKIVPLPTLEQVVKWAKARGMKMIFDVKDTDRELIEQLEQCFEAFDLYDSAIICSFFPSVIYRIKRQNKNILAGITWRQWFISYQDLEWKNARFNSSIWHGIAIILDVLWMWSIKLWVPQFLGVNMVLTERGEISENYVKFMRARGLEVCAWTVNDRSEMAWMARKLKIPFLTDVPDIAHAVIKESMEIKLNNCN